MITLLTKRFGKISAGTSINEGGKNKSALALRPFSYGRYDIYKNKDNYNINGAEVLQSFFAIGEDVDRYMAASYALELAEKVIPEEQPSPAFFNLLTDYLGAIEKRTKAFSTLTIAYQLKILELSGCAPSFTECARCGKETGSSASLRFSVEDGGVICTDCTTGHDSLDPLVFSLNDNTRQALSYMSSHSLASLEKLALDPQSEQAAKRILKAYISRHLGLDGLRSEGIDF